MVNPGHRFSSATTLVANDRRCKKLVPLWLVQTLGVQASDYIREGSHILMLLLSLHYGEAVDPMMLADIIQ